MHVDEAGEERHVAEVDAGGAGWGIAADTLAVMAQLERYGEPTWFKLGDRDLATHVARTRMLADGTRRNATVVLKDLKQRVLPPLDDELAKAASEFDTLDVPIDVAHRASPFRRRGGAGFALA